MLHFDICRPLSLSLLLAPLSPSPTRALADSVTSSPFASDAFIATGAHALTLTLALGGAGGSLAPAIPAGALRPGYVYRFANASAAARLSWAYDYGVAPWARAGTRPWTSRNGRAWRCRWRTARFVFGLY